MHQSALFHGQRFFEIYCSNKRHEDITIIEIGSQNVNGSLREVSPSGGGGRYIGLDFVEGKGVDIVLDDPYQLPFTDASVDVVVSSSCFEHSQFFWLVFLEAIRILKDDGVFYLNVPSNGFFHQHPVDCWRFYPDSGHALVAWGKRHGYNPLLLESFIGQHSDDARITNWNDYVCVVLKNALFSDKHPNRMIDSLTCFYNGYSNIKPGILNRNELSPDFCLIEALFAQWLRRK